MDSLDTNLLVRFYTDDDREQADLAEAILAGGGRLFVPTTVLIELDWVLSKAYRLRSARVVAILRHLLAIPGLQVERPAAVAAAIDAYSRGLDFADALHLTASAHCKRLLTFDRRFASRATKLGLEPACVVPRATQ